MTELFKERRVLKTTKNMTIVTSATPLTFWAQKHKKFNHLWLVQHKLQLSIHKGKKKLFRQQSVSQQKNETQRLEQLHQPSIRMPSKKCLVCNKATKPKQKWATKVNYTKNPNVIITNVNNHQNKKMIRWRSKSLQNKSETILRETIERS